MGESNIVVVSAYTTYRHLQQYCAHTHTHTHTLLSCRYRPRIYFAEGVMVDQPAHMYSLILLCTLCFSTYMYINIKEHVKDLKNSCTVNATNKETDG